MEGKHNTLKQFDIDDVEKQLKIPLVLVIAASTEELQTSIDVL